MAHVPLVAGGVGLRLGLVSDENVDEGEDLVDLGLEELRDEGSREVHGEDLPGLDGGKHEPIEPSPRN